MYGDTQEMKRATSNIARIVGLFVVPFLVTFLLGLFGLENEISDLIAWSFIVTLVAYLYGIVIGILVFMYG